ncbi:MAG: hypothetical protein M5U21_07615 [Fimbriimonadaceae bacterium]|nr:hypothetical protein [Fimbriimonadaceae bacterium]
MIDFVTHQLLGFLSRNLTTAYNLLDPIGLNVDDVQHHRSDAMETGQRLPRHSVVGNFTKFLEALTSPVN